MKASRITAHIAGAGLFAGAVAWGIHEQTQYVLATILCGPGAMLRMWVVAGCVFAIVIAGGILSWIALRRVSAEQEFKAQDGLRARHFLAAVGIMGALLFLYAVALQAVALLFLPVCTG